MSDLKVIGLCGSLRKASYNRMLLHAAVAAAPSHLKIEIREIDQIPFYNEDVEKVAVPPSVAELRAAIAAADALLIVTPEYNYSVPGVLKNSIDWLSRPPRSSCLNGKPAGIIGASPGAFGSVRAQLHLRQSFVFTDTRVMLQPEIAVMKAAEKFDQDGKLTDEPTSKLLAAYLEKLAAWIDIHDPR